MRARAVLSALLLLIVPACPKKTKTVENPTPIATPDAAPPVTQTEVQPPPPPPPPEKTADEKFTEWCHAEIDAAKQQQAAILAVAKDAPHTEASILAPWNNLQIHLNNAGDRGGLFSEVQPDKKFRDAAEACVRDVSSYATDLSLNRDVYDALAAVDLKSLTGDTKRFLEHALRDFHRSGVDKDEKTRARLKELSDQEVALGQTFDMNIREDVRTVKVDPAALEGLPADYIADPKHKPDADGKVSINTDTPDYIPFRTYSKDGAARAALYKEYLNRAWPANDDVFKKLLAVREEKAHLLGYKNWADYITEDKMIKSGKNVRDFIEKITKLSGAAARRDYAVLLKRKQKDDPKAKDVQGSDTLYYEELVKREQFGIDSTEVRKYFDFKKSRDGLLAITGKLYDIEYKPVPDADKWHADVDVYDVYRKGGDKLGRIYLDLHPREGKYKHAAQFPLVPGVDGVQLPEGALVTNFSTGLMDHDEVVTMFHEFGHLMHHVLGGKQKWVTMSGVSTEWDFVEAPSQMFEEWAWDPSTLELFATDADGKVIPEDLIKKMKAAQEFGEGYRTRIQMFYASLSLDYHQADMSKGMDTTKVMIDEQKKYSVFPYVEGTHFQTEFGHLNGYSAMYYTYMWSLVIAKDMLSEFQKHGLLDADTAHKYRDAVLVPGGTKDAADLVKDFLGRPYGFASFQKWLEHKK